MQKSVMAVMALALTVYDYERHTQDADGKGVTDRMKLCLRDAVAELVSGFLRLSYSSVISGCCTARGLSFCDR